MKKIIFFGIVLFLGTAVYLRVQAASLGEVVTFNIESSYDLNQRQQTTALLEKISNLAYFYLDQDWWKSLDYGQQSEVVKSLDFLAEEFDSKIYPVLTQTFGREWNPGIDGDPRITVLFHPMKEGSQGYFNSGDEYSKRKNPNSNEREMVYLNTANINTPYLKTFLAHEFTHLIVFNQKEKKYGVQEDVWLNEARAEIAPTILGYDVDYQNSNLRRRIKNFMDNKFDSLTEWRGQSTDYGVLNLFSQYLVDHYGKEILIDSLKLQDSGISSLNKVLKGRGFQEDFSQIFTNWAVAIYLNDCSLNKKYCYLNENLKNFRITPITNFLPSGGEGKLSVNSLSKDWAGNWFRFTGGQGIFQIEFSTTPENKFQVPYVVVDSTGKVSQINLMKFNEKGRGEMIIPEFGKDISSLTIIPIFQNKTADFSSFEPVLQFSWLVSISKSTEGEVKREQETKVQLTKEQLLPKIIALQKEISRLREELRILMSKSYSSRTCQKFENDLYFGLLNNQEVKCLQEFLKERGPEVYPEELVTGNFLSLTKEAVKRYQAAKGIIQTGYFGPLTRTAANKELGY